MNPTDGSKVIPFPATGTQATPAAKELVVHATEADFDSLIKEGNVVVDFWAEWCGPCRMIGPMVEKFSKKYEGKIKFVKVDTDANPNLSTKYQIMSIPQLYFFKDGKIIGEQRGAYPEPMFEKNFTSAFGIDANESSASNSMPMAA